MAAALVSAGPLSVLSAHTAASAATRSARSHQPAKAPAGTGKTLLDATIRQVTRPGAATSSRWAMSPP